MMNSRDDRVIHVDFEMQRRDLFRVNLSLAKWRLIAGILVTSTLMGGLVWFFWLIGDQGVLLELAPLMVGLSLLAFGGQILRLHSECRRFVAALPEAQRRVHFMFATGSDGYDVSSGESFGHVAWKDILKVIETPASFLLYRNRFEIRILPKRGFHQSSDISVFRELLQSQLGTKAKVLSQ